MTAHEQLRDELPLYAVGALSGEESERLKRHLAGCHACREELLGLQEAAAQIAMAVEPVAPPARLRGQLLARLEGAESQRSESPARAGDRRPTRRLGALGAWFWAPAFAAACFALVSVGLWRQDRALFRELRGQEQLTAEMETDQRVLKRARALIETLTAADAQHFTLAAAGARPQPEAKAVYSQQQHSLLLLAGNLNPLPPHKVYELWLLPAGGAQPIPAGTFEPDAQGSATLVLSQFAEGTAAKGFAVTIENEPGAATPTMPIVLSGTT